MTIKNIILVFLLFFSISIYANDQPRAEEYLHNYGIAYCLSKAEPYKEEANITMGGYFQIGDHRIEDQKQLEKFIDQKLHLKLDSYQYSSQPAYLMRCLEISYSKEYREYIGYLLDDLP